MAHFTEETEMLSIIFFVWLLIIIVVPNAYSEIAYFTGNKLKADLSDEKDTVYYMADYGYVLGVHDAFSGISFCSPENGTTRQMVDVVLKYLRNNPEKLHNRGRDLVRDALSLAFPCKTR